MLEYRQEQTLLELEALATQAKVGAKFRVFTSGLPCTLSPDCMGAYTFKGYDYYIAKTRRFFKRVVGVRRGLFEDNVGKKYHGGPCSFEGLHFYRFVVELQDGHGTIFALIEDSAAYLLGDALPLPASEFFTLGTRSKAKLMSAVTGQKFYFHLQFTMSKKGTGAWSILKCSKFPLHTLTTPNQSRALSDPSPEPLIGSYRVPQCPQIPNGSPMRRLLNIQPRRNPLNGIAAKTWKHDDRKHLVFALHMLQFVSLALKQATTLVDSIIERVAAYLESGDLEGT